MTIVAPAGYGKTTLISQWAERDPRSFTWARAESVARGARDWPTVGKPAVLVFDDAHELGERAAAVVSRLVAGTSPGSLVVLAGRALPKLTDPSLPLLRATGRLHELGAADLAMSRREAGATLRAFGVSVPDGQLTTLLEETEGWPAGIRRAAELLPGSRGRRNGFRDRQDQLLEFVREECLAALDRERRAFLRRTSILDRMCGALCDATLDSAGSAELLESLAAEAMFVVPLDRRGDWHRYHHLLRACLRQELLAHEPELVAELHRRAAGWLERHGDSAGALHHAHAAGSKEDFRRIFGTAALSEYTRGRSSAVQEWLDGLGSTEELVADRQAAVVAARLHAHDGRLDEAAGCLRAASRGRVRDARASARTGLVRAALCTQGPEAMLADAEGALGALAGNDPWRPYGLLMQGAARILLGDEAGAAASMVQATSAAERLEAHESKVLALAEASLLAADRGSWPEADAHLLRACGTAEEHGLEGYPVFALPLALSARTHLRNGLWADAQSAIAAAQRLLPRLTCALPWLAVQARLELAAGFVMLRDAPSASALLVEADGILTVRALGCLHRRRDRLAADVTAIPAGDGGQTIRLSRAELRLLPLLGTHLSFREIGAHLFLSRHTVKTQAISAYRKLGASSRREAVVEAARLALIDAPTDLAA